ncbi:glycoside hydrolase family 99-like domain-containing protein [Methylocystis sp. S23]
MRIRSDWGGRREVPALPVLNGAIRRSLRVACALFAICVAAPAPVFAQARAVWDLWRHPENLSPIHRYRCEAERVFAAENENIFSFCPGAQDEGDAFAISSIMVEGTRPLYRLRQGDGAFYYTARELSPSQRSAQRSGLLGYVFEKPSAGLLSLHLWCGESESRCALSAKDDEDEKASYSRDGLRHVAIVGYVFANAFPKRVGAYYFGMFAKGAWRGGEGPAARKTKQLFGTDLEKSDYWWAGVRDLYTGRMAEVMKPRYPSSPVMLEGDWSYLKPQIGWYDQGDEQTLERHIDQATAHGVSFFDFYWYWDKDTGYQRSNDGLETFLRAKNSSDIDFMISVCEHGWYLSVPHNEYENVADLIVRRYISRANYLRTRDGRPIIQICDASGFRIDDDASKPRDIDFTALGEFIAALRNAAHRLIGVDLLITARMDYKIPDKFRTSGLFDAGSCIAPVVDRKSLSGNYAKIPQWISDVAHGWAFMPCFTENMDERPRLGIMKEPQAIFYFAEPVTAGNFEKGLRGVNAWMDERPNSEPSRFLALYAWNEWHEGGILEPNARDGAALISRIPGVFGVPYLAPKGARP